jgi:tRNA A-37 threonylcarbamoyl transferase component Bud32
MAIVHITPRYRAALSEGGLTSAGALLDWDGVILSGHPSRHVLRVRLGGESFILKKEHRVSWRDRLASAWAGYGWASKSVREARLLEHLRAAGVPCPEVVATGEDDGRAFVLLREATGMMDLRAFLSRPLPRTARQMLARALGRELARIHAAGLSQPDLYAKHVLVRSATDGFRFCFLDWQRSGQQRWVSWERRLHDLAALDASLAGELASDRVRLICLQAYLRDAAAHCGPQDSAKPTGLLTWLTRRRQALPLAGRKGQAQAMGVAVRCLAERRFSQRKLRELRQPPLPAGTQQLLWLQPNERLCIARDFYEELGGRLPSWVPQDAVPSPHGVCVEHRLILLGAGRTGHLVQRWSRTAAWLPAGKYPAPELERAAAIFRLQRFGVAGPRLLAMGHRTVTAWQRFSFLLTEPAVGQTLGTLLRQGTSPVRRQRLLRELGVQLRQMHEAGFTLRSEAEPWQTWVVNGEHRLALANVEQVERTTESWQLGQRALEQLATPQAAGLVLSRADRLRVLLGYVQRRRLDISTRRLLRAMRVRERRVA